VVAPIRESEGYNGDQAKARMQTLVAGGVTEISVTGMDEKASPLSVRHRVGGTS